MSSFRKKGPGALASGLIGAAAGLAIIAGAIALLSFPAFAGGVAFTSTVIASP